MCGGWLGWSLIALQGSALVWAGAGVFDSPWFSELALYASFDDAFFFDELRVARGASASFSALSSEEILAAAALPVRSEVWLLPRPQFEIRVSRMQNNMIALKTRERSRERRDDE